MKIYLLFISLLVVMHSSGQTDSADFYNNFIGFVSNDVDVTSDFFDGPSGNIVASIEKPFDGWVHYVIILQEDSWVQVKNVSIAPEIKKLDKLNKTWLKSSNVWFNLLNDGSVCYSEPNEKSAQTLVKCTSVNLILVNGGWAQAKYTIEGTEYIGWFKKESLCGMPWTTCNY